jgi:DNA-directed RNA polymerase subunit M/transcription elongation factor TFIIS
MQNEKNRLGETEFVERAEEDFYFAAKDRALLQEMKTETRKVEATVRQERATTCPKCGEKFVVYNFMDFVLDAV